ncbi:hypothetical protein [Desulfobacca acetoxidans]|uniref:Uncharacterized protein n=1 Tax=Desulfobacca acetoxidans (strain ATCC 700848 / DSM 11109 / ASRB2) TaxID=880072 RepID=F2NEP0_DESAR|nr:hypothetical protein [Desulfobacca acetoxidans]AEB08230.1 hypothetical protein Desac_0339 [Desulfobacca acetoxidans DSM 11109]HAY21705.1 hypothetical protein [Desulfobacterales bacterium]
MSHEFRLYLQALDSHLRVAPLGKLTGSGVEQILGAAQAGLRVFPVVVVDLQGAENSTADTLTRLEEGLRQLVSEKKLILGLEPEKWILQGSPPEKICHCCNNCENCPCRSRTGEKAKKTG